MGEKKVKVSGIVLTFNSENLIEKCLESLDWLDEVIIVDDNSKDKTLEKVNKFKNTIVVEAKGSFSKKRNIGLKKASGEWLLYVDSDERVTKELKQEILSIINSSTTIHCYAIPRRNFIFKKEFKHSGQYPDYVKRFFKKEKLVKWTGELHEEPKYKGELGHLENVLIHKKQNNLSDMVEKTNKWSQIEANLMYKAKHPKMNILRFFSVMCREFWLRMIKQMAFLDGVEGIIYAIHQVFSRTISYAKLWEMQIMKNVKN